MSHRWEDYVIAFGDLNGPPEALWEAAAAAAGEQQSMYVLGVGFDPRSLVGLQQFLALDHPKPPIVGLIELPPPSPASGLSARALASDNRDAFDRLVASIEVRVVPHQEVHARSNAGPRVARALTDDAFVASIGHLIIDISSLPASLYFPMIAATLASVDRNVAGFPGEVQVVACENPEVDAAILKLGVNEAAVVGGFRGALEFETDPTGTVIWAPVVGEHAGPALQAIHDFLAPGDVCPILPFPARNPRRADNLLLEHQVVLLDAFRVTPGNLIYADERNPFDLYRTLSRLQEDFREALKALEPTTLALSTHSSKLLSLGALLAAYEHQLPIVAAPAVDYEVADVDLTALGVGNQVTCAWLTGVPYQ
ncbi:MAG: hypothetical protein ABIX10_02360 [Acidimicrobiales bacterium]